MTNQNTISYPFIQNKTSTSRISRNIEGNIVTILKPVENWFQKRKHRSNEISTYVLVTIASDAITAAKFRVTLDQRRDQWPKVCGRKKEEKDRGNLPRSVMRGKSSKLNWVCIARLPSSVIEHAVVFVSRKCHFVCKPTIASTRWKQRVVVALLFTEGEPREKYPLLAGKQQDRSIARRN